MRISFEFTRMARYKIPHVKNKDGLIPTSLLSKWDKFSPENLKYFCGSDLEEFLCYVAVSGKKRKPNQSQQTLQPLKLLSKCLSGK